MSNEAALLVILTIWLLGGRGLNLCLLIALYYCAFIMTNVYGVTTVAFMPEDAVYGTYAIQCSIDSVFLTLTIALSAIYKKFIKIYLAYAAIIGTSLVLNGAMMYGQMLDLSIVYHLHSFRQELSIPLDVLFAALGSAIGGQAYISHRLHTSNGADYNRSNSDYPFI